MFATSTFPTWPCQKPTFFHQATKPGSLTTPQLLLQSLPLSPANEVEHGGAQRLAKSHGRTPLCALLCFDLLCCALMCFVLARSLHTLLLVNRWRFHRYLQMRLKLDALLLFCSPQTHVVRNLRSHKHRLSCNSFPRVKRVWTVAARIFPLKQWKK